MQTSKTGEYLWWQEAGNIMMAEAALARLGNNKFVKFGNTKLQDLSWMVLVTVVKHKYACSQDDHCHARVHFSNDQGHVL